MLNYGKMFVDFTQVPMFLTGFSEKKSYEIRKHKAEYNRKLVMPKQDDLGIRLQLFMDTTNSTNGRVWLRWKKISQIFFAFLTKNLE